MLNLLLLQLSNANLDRRSFCAAGITLAVGTACAESSGAVRFGMIADLHHSLMPGAQDRLESFLEAANRRSPDFLVQLGDLCHGFSPAPTPDQKRFLDTWNRVRAPRYNVLGNHEMDHSAKAPIMGLLEMPRNYYSFDSKKFHFVVLDCMHVKENGKVLDYVEGSYFHRPAEQINWVDEEQLEWLAADLRATSLPTIVFTHPCINAFWAKGAHETRTNVREALEKANAESRRAKVIACFSGHHHADHHSVRAGVNYFLVNSASYYWVGEAYGSLAKYRDPLFTFVTIKADGSLEIEGKDSTFVPPTPTELHHPDAPYVTASIKARNIRFDGKKNA